MKATKRMWTISYDGTYSRVTRDDRDGLYKTERAAQKVLKTYFEDELEGHRATVAYFRRALRSLKGEKS